MTFPKPLPPRVSPTAPKAEDGRRSARPKSSGDAFSQHRTFVQEWHRRIRSRDAQTVWHYLFSIGHRDGRFQYASADRIAERTGVHERTARRCVKLLATLGVLDVERVKKPGRGKALGFRIPSPLPSTRDV